MFWEFDDDVLAGKYRSILNHKNPLSNHGEVVVAFANLVSQVLREENGVAISPKQFKDVIGRFFSQFRNSDQQDSQEFLGCLLDGLNEDMNQGISVPGGSGLDLQSMPEWVRPIAGKEDDDDDLPDEVRRSLHSYNCANVNTVM